MFMLDQVQQACWYLGQLSISNSVHLDKSTVSHETNRDEYTVSQIVTGDCSVEMSNERLGWKA
jgi:hypothetical protein